VDGFFERPAAGRALFLQQRHRVVSGWPWKTRAQASWLTARMHAGLRAFRPAPWPPPRTARARRRFQRECGTSKRVLTSATARGGVGHAVFEHAQIFLRLFTRVWPWTELHHRMVARQEHSVRGNVVQPSRSPRSRAAEARPARLGWLTLAPVKMKRTSPFSRMRRRIRSTAQCCARPLAKRASVAG